MAHAHVNPIQLQKFLKGLDYPVRKEDLIARAAELGADQNVCDTLKELPDEVYEAPIDVSEAVGRLNEEEAGRRPAKEHAKGGDHAKERDHAREREHAATRRHTGSNEFLIEAMEDNKAEVKVCQLALGKSANEDVKAFAQSMIDEHGKMAHEMEQLCKKKNLQTPRDIRREQKMTVDELSSLSGAVFEQRWIQYNIDTHERDVKVFRHYAEEETDHDIRDMAKRGAEILSRHLKMAHDLGKKLAKA